MISTNALRNPSDYKTLSTAQLYNYKEFHLRQKIEDEESRDELIVLFTICLYYLTFKH